MNGTIDRQRDLRKIDRITGPNSKKVEEALGEVHATGLNVYSSIFRYMKVCGIKYLEEDVIIDSCKAFLKYRAGIRGKPWPYFIRVLHTKYHTFKPKDLRLSIGPRIPMSINDILKNMGIGN